LAGHVRLRRPGWHRPWDRGRGDGRRHRPGPGISGAGSARGRRTGSTGGGTAARPPGAAGASTLRLEERLSW